MFSSGSEEVSYCMNFSPKPVLFKTLDVCSASLLIIFIVDIKYQDKIIASVEHLNFYVGCLQ